MLLQTAIVSLNPSRRAEHNVYRSTIAQNGPLLNAVKKAVGALESALEHLSTLCLLVV